MCTDKDLSPSERDELTSAVNRLQMQVARQLATIRELQKQLAEAQRAGKAPGRSVLQGQASRKAQAAGPKAGNRVIQLLKAPSADELTEPIIDVSVSAESCPGCGGTLEHEGVGYAYVTDLPTMPKPQVKEYRVQICRCRSCGKRVRGSNREVAP